MKTRSWTARIGRRVGERARTGGIGLKVERFNELTEHANIILTEGVFGVWDVPFFS